MARVTVSNSGPEATVKRLGISRYTIVPHYDLGQLSQERRIQIREGTHSAPKFEASKYANQMKAGSVFPPIVVTYDYWIVDGSTRFAAAGLAGIRDLQAIELDIGWESATPAQRSLLLALGASLNQENGRALSSAEVNRLLRDALPLNWEDQQYVREFGVKLSQVKQVKRAIAAEARLSECFGNRVPRNLRDSQLSALGDTRTLTLDDASYKGLASLVADANLTQTETRKIVAQIVLGTKSPRQVLRDWRGELREQISEVAAGGTGTTTMSRMAGMHIGFFAANVGNEADMVTNEFASAHRLHELDKALTVLTRLKKLQSDVK